MQNFEFYNPTKIIFGAHTIYRLNDLIAKEARILILYGGSSAEKTGTLDEVKSALAGHEFYLFGGIEPNPTYETLMKSVELVKSKHINFLLAVGGGSVIDGTKFVAVACKATNFEKDPWEILETQGAYIKEALPLATVLTLPATGSEMNDYSVVTFAATKAKLSFQNVLVFPIFSILDPSKTLTLQTPQIINGIVDTFIHITEQYLTYPVNALVQDKFAEGLLQILIEIGPEILNNPNDYDLRANFMWVATLALNGLIGAGVPQDWATHAIGHELTALHGIDHGCSLAIILPALLTIQTPYKRKKLLQYARHVWSINSGTEEQQIKEAIFKTKAFFQCLGMKTTLSDYGINAEDIKTIVSQLEAHGMTHLGESQEITLEVSKQILMNSL